MEGGNGTGDIERNVPLQVNRKYKRRGLALSSKPERGPRTPQGKPARVLQQTAHHVRQPSCNTSLPFQLCPSRCPTAVSPSTEHRGSLSSPANTPSSSCAACRGHRSQHRSQAGFALAPEPPSPERAPSPQVPVFASS